MRVLLLFGLLPGVALVASRIFAGARRALGAGLGVDSVSADERASVDLDIVGVFSDVRGDGLPLEEGDRLVLWVLAGDRARLGGALLEDLADLVGDGVAVLIADCLLFKYKPCRNGLRNGLGVGVRNSFSSGGGIAGGKSIRDLGVAGDGLYPVAVRVRVR